ncbi:MAG: amidohydrolase family protein [Thermoleophilia bacterium]|nr:amidohydrolase family protein [Thermoleophilia bacterium]
MDDLAALEREAIGALGLPADAEVWDAHTHLGRDRDGHHLDPADLVGDLDAAGIACACAFPADEPGADGAFTAANAAVLAAARRFAGRIVPFCRVDPTGDWAPALARAAAGGARGLKLHPVAQRFALDHPGSVGAADEAARRGWPVLVHAGYGARPIAAALAALLEQVPDVRLILAHGGRGDFRAVREVALAHPAVGFDTALAHLPDLVSIPPDRLAFGSDRPYGEHASALHLVGLAARVAGWGPAEVRGVAGGNLRAWLGP